MTTEELRKSLLAAPKNGFTRVSAEDRAEIDAFAKRYMAFMDEAKTEREATDWAIREAEKYGFVPYVPGMKAEPGDKIYYNNRGKAIALAVIGTESLAQGAEYGNAVVEQMQDKGDDQLHAQENHQKAEDGSQPGYNLTGQGSHQFFRDLSAAALFPGIDHISQLLGQGSHCFAAQLHELGKIPAADGVFHDRG